MAVTEDNLLAAGIFRCPSGLSYIVYLNGKPESSHVHVGVML